MIITCTKEEKCNIINSLCVEDIRNIDILDCDICEQCWEKHVKFEIVEEDKSGR